MKKSSFDFIIIGAGIVGSSLALSLKKKYKYASCLIIEKESKLSCHQTGRNSGVIHSGIYYKPNSLKSLNCKRGYEMLVDYCDNYNLEYKIKGKLIVARNETEKLQLNFLSERAKKNGLTGVRSLNKHEIKIIEPNINIEYAIHVPQTGLVDYKNLNKVFINEYTSLGGEILYNKKVISHDDKRIICQDDFEVYFKKIVFFSWSSIG